MKVGLDSNIILNRINCLEYKICCLLLNSSFTSFSKDIPKTWDTESWKLKWSAKSGAGEDGWSHTRPCPSSWDGCQLWVVGFAPERIQEWATVKWKKIYSGKKHSIDRVRAISEGKWDKGGPVVWWCWVL